MDVEFNGDAQGLADAIAPRDFKELEVEIVGFTANKLEIRVK